jgi:signal transduction histidine kinase
MLKLFRMTRLIFYWLVMFLPCAVSATVFLPESGKMELAGHLEQLQTSALGLSIEEVATGRAGRFEPIPGHLIESVGKTREVWLRFSAASQSLANQSAILRVQPPLLDYIDVYQREGDGWRRLSGGDGRPVSGWLVDDRTPSFPIELTGGTPSDYYVHIRQDGLLNAYFELYSRQAFQEMRVAETLYFGIYIGILGSLILSNLLHWISLRDSLYGELSFYILLRAGFFLSFSGLIFQYLLPEHPDINKQLLQSLTGWTIASHILLIMRVLDIPSFYPKLANLLRLFALMVIVIALLVWSGLFTRLIGLLFMVLLLVGFIGVAISAAHARRGRPLGKSLLLIMVVVFICHFLGVLPVLGFNWGMQIDLNVGYAGSLIVAISVHIAVALRVIELKRARIASERAANEAKLHAESERAARREQADFVSMLFHEIKTPLAEIESAVTILEHLDEGGNGTARDRYDTIHGAVDRLNQLVEKSLDRDRQGLDASYLSPISLNLRELSERVVASFRGARGHQLELQGERELPLIQGDPELLRVALANLLDNAIKYTPEGGRIRVELGREAGCQLVVVRDSGPGMGDDMASRAFDRFWRGSSATGASGAGLGLYLVRKIIQAHGGEIRIGSQPGGGSSFIVALPEGA